MAETRGQPHLHRPSMLSGLHRAPIWVSAVPEPADTDVWAPTPTAQTVQPKTPVAGVAS